MMSGKNDRWRGKVAGCDRQRKERLLVFPAGSSHLLTLVCLFLLAGYHAHAQSYTLRLHSLDNNQLLVDQHAEEGSFPSASRLMQALQEIVPGLQEKGWLAASIDSIGITQQNYDAYVFLGQQYRWAAVSFDSVPAGVMIQAAINKEQWSGRTLSPKQISRVTRKLLEWAENNGYPFAQVALRLDDSGSVERLRGHLLLDKGSFERLDTIEIKGDVKVSRDFILNYLDIRQGAPYNEQKLRTISARLRELSFLQERSPWSVKFSEEGNALTLDLTGKKSNQLNALVGLLPNSAETGKFLLTIDALLAFQNILSQGEKISVSYQNLQYKSPRLKAELGYPYLLNTPVGVDLRFDLFKKDTSFRRTTLLAGLRYQLSPAEYVLVSYNNQSNRLITIDTASIKASKKLPDNIDVSANGAGIEFGWNRTDYRLSPRRGWEGRISGTGLKRAVRKSDEITRLNDGSGFDYNSLYDTLISRREQYIISGNLAYYIPLAPKLVFRPAYSGGWSGGASLFRNELFQIGGFRSLRGFDEQSIFASQYHILSLELRLLLDQNSYVSLFSDNGYVVSEFNGYYNDDLYNGFGLAATLETRSGLFTIGYALGRNEANPIQFRQSKIHFGYVAFF